MKLILMPVPPAISKSVLYPSLLLCFHSAELAFLINILSFIIERCMDGCRTTLSIAGGFIVPVIFHTCIELYCANKHSA